MSSGQKDNIYIKLFYIQQNLKAPKNQYNEFSNYHYRSCEDIQEALKPLLQEMCTVLLLSDEVINIGDRYYIKASAILCDTESGEQIVNTAYAREPDSKPKMDNAQITGSCSSYARKYALNGLFCIDDAKDPDTMDNTGRSQTANRADGSSHGNHSDGSSQQSTIHVQRQHINAIRAEIARTGAQEESVLERYRLKSLQDMTMEQFRNAMGIFKKMPDMMSENEYQMTLDGIEQYKDEMPYR